jgi:predicted nuclease of predicted toxin-antitoxin system
MGRSVRVAVKNLFHNDLSLRQQPIAQARRMKAGCRSVGLLFDANLSPEVARRLHEAGHDSAHVHVGDIGLLTAADQDRVLVTADADFGALLALGSLAAPSVVLLRSADHMRPAEQAALPGAGLPTVQEALSEGAIVSLSPDRLRRRTFPMGVENERREVSGDH